MMLDRELGSDWRSQVTTAPEQSNGKENEEHKLIAHAKKAFKDEPTCTTCLTKGKFASNGYNK